MTDLVLFMKLLNSSGTAHKVFTDEDFMNDKALVLGAVLSVCVRDSVDFYFDKEGKIIGTATGAIKSFKKADGQ